MLKRMTLEEKFLAFLDTKKGDYNWHNADACACAQFCRYAFGTEPANKAVAGSRWGGMTWEDQRRIWASKGSFNELAFGDGSQDNWTFEQLRNRVLQVVANA